MPSAREIAIDTGHGLGLDLQLLMAQHGLAPSDFVIHKQGQQAVMRQGRNTKLEGRQRASARPAAS